MYAHMYAIIYKALASTKPQGALSMIIWHISLNKWGFHNQTTRSTVWLFDIYHWTNEASTTKPQGTLYDYLTYINVQMRLPQPKYTLHNQHASWPCGPNNFACICQNTINATPTSQVIAKYMPETKYPANWEHDIHIKYLTCTYWGYMQIYKSYIKSLVSTKQQEPMYEYFTHITEKYICNIANMSYRTIILHWHVDPHMQISSMCSQGKIMPLYVPCMNSLWLTMWQAGLICIYFIFLVDTPKQICLSHCIYMSHYTTTVVHRLHITAYTGRKYNNVIC